MSNHHNNEVIAGGFHTSRQAKLRLRKRHRHETIFKYISLSAILIASLFLCFLLYVILERGLPAFSANSLRLPSASLKLDGQTTSAINRSIRNVLKQRFAYLTTRAQKRELYAIITNNPGYLLKKQFADKPPTAIPEFIDILLSDDSDLYLKQITPTTKTFTFDRPFAVTSTGEKTVRIEATDNLFSDLQQKLDLLSLSAIKTSGASTSEAPVSGDPKRLIVLNAQTPSVNVFANGAIIQALKIGSNSIEGRILVQSNGDGTSRNLSYKLIKTPAANRRISDLQIALIDDLKADQKIISAINWQFFTASSSSEPELAGIWGAMVGSFWTMVITLIMALPLGVAAAIYLTEFAKKNRWTDFIEVNINNLAAVPSIVFGLLGLAIFINTFGLPRSAALTGGMILALMTLPTIIIASKAALTSVPPSIRDAALGVGASKMQMIFHHVLPLALPGIFTGTIIGMAQALGETAPLLMIGMVAFVADVARSPLEATSVLPVEVFLSYSYPELAFKNKAAGTIIVLLVFLVIMNALAVILRKRFEKKW